jgi:GNAT superfamily N-acetyltransferase
MNSKSKEEMYQKLQGQYLISTDKSKLDLAVIHDYLCHRSYWAAGRSLKAVKRSIEHSLCFGVHQQDGPQVGFARIVTDYTTFAWLCDLFILESWQNKGLGKWLVKSIQDHPDLQSIRRWLLATRDAHGLYNKYGGFKPINNPNRWMTRIVESTRGA